MTKRFFSLLLALAMILTIGVSAFADSQKGSLTIENTAKGRTYTLYKVFDATTDGKGAAAYKLISGTTLPENSYFTATNTGDVFILDLASDEDNLSKGAVEWLKSNTSLFNNNKIGEKTGTGKAVTFENLDYGYYYVNTGVGAAVTINSVLENAKVFDKNNDKPGPAPKTPTDPSGDKRPLKDFTVADGAEVNKTVDAGETLNFTIAFQAVNFINTGTDYNTITNYVVEDIPENLVIDWTTLNVLVSGTPITGYTTNTNTVTIPWDCKYESPAIVELTYSAKMPVGTATNSVKISYNDCKGNNYEIEDSDPNNPDVSLANYKVSVKVSPTDAEGGASYKLYKTDTNGKKLYYKFDSSTDTVTWVEIPAEATVGTEFKGVKNGDYFVEEVTSPKGYNGVEDIPVTIAGNDKQVDITYNKGVRLPSTGGIGTKVFYVMGGVLVAAAAVLLIYKKKMSAQQ